MDDRSPQRELIFLALVTLAALAIRLVNIGHESLWYDEACSLEVASGTVWQQLNGDKTDPGNPSLYFILLRFWATLFGPSIEAARAFSALTGALAVPAVWLVCREMQVGTQPTRLAMMITALSPPLVYLGREARCFAFFATMGTLTLWSAMRVGRHVATQSDSQQGNSEPFGSKVKDAVLRVVNGPGRVAWWTFIVLSVALMHIHYYAFFVVATLGCYLLLVAWSSRAPSILDVIAAGVIIAILFLPWLPIFRWQLSLGAARSEQSWWQHAVMMPMFSAVGRTLIWKEHGNIAVGLFAILVTSAFVPPLVALIKHRQLIAPDLFFVAGVVLFAVGVSVFVTPMIHSHYLSVTFPVLYILLARGFWLAYETQTRFVRPAAYLLCILAFFSLLSIQFGKHKHDWRRLTAVISEKNSSAPVFLYEDIAASPYLYYLPSTTTHRIIKPFGADGSNWQSDEILGAMRRKHAGFWFILYDSYAATKREVPSILEFVDQHFEKDFEYRVPGIAAMLLRPKRS